MVAKVAEFHMFLHVVVIKVFFHPANITPVQVPVALPVNITTQNETSHILLAHSTSLDVNSSH